MFQNTEALQAKVIDAAKSAVIKVAYHKIDERENLDEATKTFLKEIAKNVIDKTFERLSEEYKKYTQKEIEEDASKIVDDQINAVTSAYLKINKK